MQIAKIAKRCLLVIPGCVLLSTVTWGQSWGPRATVPVEFGVPAPRVEVARRWDDRRWDHDRHWPDREWRRYQRREERREHYRRY